MNENWKFKAVGRIQSGPYLNNGILFFGIWDRLLYAINIETGKELWRFQTIGIDVKNIFAENSIVFCSSSGGYLHAISIRTGKELWKFKAGFRVSSIPSTENGIVYFGCEDGYIYGIDIPTGELIWKYYASAPISSSLICNNLIFFSSHGYISNGTIYASAKDACFFKIINIKNQNILQVFSSDYIVTPYKLGQLVFFGTGDSLFSYDTINNKIIWRIFIGGAKNIQKFDNDQIIAGRRNEVFLVNILSGGKTSLCRIDGYPDSIKLIKEKLFYIDSGKVIGIDLATKKKISEYESNYTFSLGINTKANKLFYGNEYEMFCKTE